MFDQTLPSPFYQEIKSNMTVLHVAVKEGNIELVRYLLRIPLPNKQDFVNMKVCHRMRQNETPSLHHVHSSGLFIACGPRYLY